MTDKIKNNSIRGGNLQGEFRITDTGDVGAVSGMRDIEENLPKGWDYANIPELINNRGLFKDGDWIESKDQDPKGDVRLIQLADIGEINFKDKSNRYLDYDRAIELNCTFLEKGDLLIARLGEPLCKCCIFPGGNKKSVTAVDVCIIRTGTKNINPKILLYFFNSNRFKHIIQSYQSGTTRIRISRKNLELITLPIPPLNEQNRIVAKIEELFTQLDAGIASLQAAQVKLGQYRKAVLKHAFEGKLTEAWREAHKDEIEPASVLLERIREERRKDKKYKELPPVDTEGLPELPEGWIWTQIGGIGKVSGGVTKNAKKQNQGEEFPFLKVGNVYFNRLILDNIETIQVTESDFLKYQLSQGDLLVVEGNGSIEQIGRVAIWDGSIPKCIHQNHIIKVRFPKEINNKYALYWLISKRGRYEITQIASSTSGLYTLSITKVESLNIPLPSKDEQEKIVSNIEYSLSFIDHLEIAIVKGMQHSTNLRQSILKKAFEGRLVTQDPSDEPASVLLDRIRQEKLTAEPKKRGRKNKGT